MPLAEVSALFADRLTPTTLDLVCELHDGITDLDRLVELAQWCERFSPHVGLEPLDQTYAVRVPGGRYQTTTAVESLVLDVTRLSHLFGSEQKLVQQIMTELRGLGYHARIGVGHSLAAAWLASHWLATRDQQHMAILSQDPDAKQLQIDDLPLEALRLPAGILTRFYELGIQDIHQLNQLPRDCLRSRFGDLVSLRLDQLAGHVDEVLHTHQPLPDFQVQWPLEPPSDRSDVIEQVLQQLVTRLTAMLRKHDLGVVELQCDFSGQGGPWSLHVRLFQPSVTAEHLWELLLLQCEQLTLPAAASGIRLLASQTAPLERHQEQLFSGRSSSDWSRTLAQLVNRLSSRLGNQRVIRARLQEDAQPEQAWYPLPWTSKKQTRARRRADPPASAAWRPLHLHREPIPLNVQITTPSPPTRFKDRGQLYQVARSWGPERVETGWWRGSSIRRDYYRLETTTGNRFWIFQQLTDRQWFLHGEYL